MEDAPETHPNTTTPPSSTSKIRDLRSGVFQTPMKLGSTASLSQAMMITLGDRPTPDALAEAVKVDLRHGSTVRAHEFLEWLFAVAIGKTDEIPTESKTQDEAEQTATETRSQDEADQTTTEPKTQDEADETTTEAKAQDKADKSATEPKLQDIFKEALTLVRKIANKRDTNLKSGLKDLVKVLAKEPKSKEEDVYEPLIKALNAAFSELGDVSIAGLEKPIVNPIAINHSTKSPASDNPQADGGYRPDIAFIPWQKMGQRPVQSDKPSAFSSAGQSRICTEPWDGQRMEWREILTTLEVKHDKLSKKQCNDKLDILDLQYGDKQLKDRLLDPNFDVTTSDSNPPPPPPVRSMAHISRPVSGNLPRKTRSNSRSQEPQSMLSYHRPSTGIMKIQRETSTSMSGRNGKKRPAEEGDSASARDAKKPKPEAKAEKGKVKHHHRVQTSVYATHMLSSSFDKTHSIAMNIVGTEISVGWFDHSGPIESHSFDIIDDLPHFLLLLLILQRFQEVHWGYYSSGKDSVFKVWQSEDNKQNDLLILKFVAQDLRKKGETAKTSIYVFLDDLIHQVLALRSRGTRVYGARDTEPEPMSNTKDIEGHNNMVMKLAWIDDTRHSEAKILKKATELGESIPFIHGHIPELVAEVDVQGWNANTGTIRRFLERSGVPVNGTRGLRILFFKRLLPISKLESDDMFKAYADILFCHRALWRMGIRHGDISVANMMWNSTTGKGVLNDYDLAKLVSQSRPMGQNEITGTLPFLALDLLNDRGTRGLEAPLYRHEAESFAWVFIYLCCTVAKREDGTFGTGLPHSIQEWFSNLPSSIFSSKLRLGTLWELDPPKAPLHKKLLPLARRLYDFWTIRYVKRDSAIREYASALRAAGRRPRFTPNIVSTTQVKLPEPYQETEDEELWELLIREHDPLDELEDEENFIYINDLWERYLNMQWPKVVETLDDNINGAPTMIVHQENV